MSSGSLRDLKDAAPPAAKRKHNSAGDVVEYGESHWLKCEDRTDGLPETLRFNWFDMFCIIFSIATYVVDLGMDIYVAYVYHVSEYIGYFVLTLVFIIIPSVSMTAFSLRWYVIDMDNQTIPKPSCTKWVIRLVVLLLQIAPVLRYLDALLYGLKSRKAAKRGDRASQYKYYAYMINEDADSTLLRLFEAFMESAPQVTLQLYILIYYFNDPKGPFAGRSYFVQALAVGTSLVSLAWSLSAYHRSLRYAQQDKTNISYKGTLLQFSWHLCSLSARVFALAVFAATYPLLILPVCMCHFCAMLAWLIVQKTKSCENQCEEALFNLIVAFIYIFTFFNVREEPTRYKYAIFYTICLIENSLLLFAWFISFNSSTPDISWFRISGLVGDYVLFFLGILFMALYYVYFHPTVGLYKSQQKNPNKAQSTASISFPAPDVTVKAKSLARKNSIDTTQMGLGSNSHSATSSHRNVNLLDTSANPANSRKSSNSILKTSSLTAESQQPRSNSSASSLLKGLPEQNNKSNDETHL